MAERYEAGTDAREAIRLLEVRGCPLREDERDALVSIGRTLEGQGATGVLRSWAREVGSVREILDVFHPIGGGVGRCGVRPTRRAPGRARGDARADAVGDARERYLDRARAAWRGDARKAEPCGCPTGDPRERYRARIAAREEYVNRMKNLWRKKG